MSRPLARLALATALAAPALACSRATGGARAADAPTVVAFVNQGFEQANVYAIGISGDWFRVGTVSPGQTTRLRIPAALLTGQQLNIVARPFATSRLVGSGPINLAPGDTVTLTLAASASTLMVLPGLP